MFSCSHVKAKRRRDHSQPLKSRNMQHYLDQKTPGAFSGTKQYSHGRSFLWATSYVETSQDDGGRQKRMRNKDWIITKIMHQKIHHRIHIYAPKSCTAKQCTPVQTMVGGCGPEIAAAYHIFGWYQAVLLLSQGL